MNKDEDFFLVPPRKGGTWLPTMGTFVQKVEAYFANEFLLNPQ